jgi:glycosyltransferase involved in cell wall biosynthesis
MDFSVIIPSYNSGGSLDWCLEGLHGQDYDGTYEVIAVESGDTGHIPAASRRFPRVRFVSSPARLFAGQARNAGVKHSTGKRLAFIDGDCRPHKGWLTALGEAHARGFEAVSGALDNADEGSVTGTAEYLVSHSSYSSAIPEYVLTGSTAASGNLSVNRDVFERAGGFAGTERANDFLFSQALYGLKVRILFDPAARALTRNSTAMGDYLRGQVNRGYWNGRARVELGLEGGVAAKFPPIALGLLPIRAWRLFARCVRYPIVRPAELALCLPACKLGLACWTWGFMKACRAGGKVGLNEREKVPSGWEDFTVTQGEH